MSRDNAISRHSPERRDYRSHDDFHTGQCFFLSSTTESGLEMEDLLHTRREATPDRGPSNVSHPLRGVVLCCTSIPPEKRSELALQAEQMGALHKYDLTSEITHLVVGDYDTPKYRYVAKERPDVKVLTPQWVEAVRQLWIEDQPIDVLAIERECTLPTFATLRICLTGFEDPLRQEIIERVLDNGGEYHGDLTKAVTHLIVNNPEGAKYKHAKAWGLRLVSVEWLQDSVERGMILDEKLFNPEWQADERGKGAWNRQRTSLGKRPRNDDAAQLDDGKRKLRRTASTKLCSQNEKIWGDIVGGNNDIQAANSGEWGGTTTAANTEKSPRQQAKPSDAQTGSSLESNSLSYRTAASTSEGTFSGCHFYIHGFDRRKTQLLESHLLSHEAEISTTLHDLITRQSPKSYLVVSHLTIASTLPEVPQSATHIQAVTEWWVERCIGTKILVDVADYCLGRPFPQIPLQRFEELTICSTGFEGLQLLHISKAVALMGAKYEEIFSKDVSVLICNSCQNIRREKLILAHEWKIPAVSLNWLLESIQMGDRQRFSPYIQRIKKNKTESKSALAIDNPTSRNGDQTKGNKPEAKSRCSGGDARPAKTSKLDQTAFQDETVVKIEEEESVAPALSPDPIQPLSEITSNSPRKSQTPAKAPKSEDRIPPPAIAQHAISNAMTSLLAKSKTAASHASDQVEQREAQEVCRKSRAPSRILGRAASNVSAASASSVDSTASTGQAVVWPSNKSGSGDQRTSSSLRSDVKQDAVLAAFTKNLEAAEADQDDSQPPPTQMLYEDLESMKYQAKLLARIKGEKVVRKEREKVATIASLDNGGGPRMRKSRALRERQGGGLR